MEVLCGDFHRILPLSLMGKTSGAQTKPYVRIIWGALKNPHVQTTLHAN